MDCKIFIVKVIAECASTDQDNCPTWEDVVVFENKTTSKVNAIKWAQKEFAKRPTNDNVRSVWGVVMAQTITPNGVQSTQRVYNLYKLRSED